MSRLGDCFPRTRCSNCRCLIAVAGAIIRIMEAKQNPKRLIIRKMTLDEESGDGVPVGTTPADRLMMMWQIAQDCWSFVPGHDAKREFQRHVVSVERRGR